MGLYTLCAYKQCTQNHSKLKTGENQNCVIDVTDSIIFTIYVKFHNPNKKIK